MFMAAAKKAAKKAGIAALFATCPMYGCAMYTTNPMEEGSVIVAGSSEGVRSLFDGLNGLVTNAKTADPMGQSAYWTGRAHFEEQKTKRGCRSCGFLQKLTGSDEVQGS